LFTKQEISFIRTSCQILGLDGNAMIKSIQNEVKDNGMKQPRKVMEYLQARLRELADRVENHKQPTPNPTGIEGGDGSAVLQRDQGGHESNGEREAGLQEHHIGWWRRASGKQRPPTGGSTRARWRAGTCWRGQR
jgi:hypothetical protein